MESGIRNLLDVQNELDDIADKIEFIAWVIARTDDEPLVEREAYGCSKMVESIGHRIREISAALGEVVKSEVRPSAA